jgi:two-component system, chemotaxis family, chemotaxis protein CheY
MRILIVEDNPTSRNIMGKLVKKYGDFDVSKNGEEALFMLSNALLENNYYDLICLDIMMPNIDGYEVLRSIREFEDENNIADQKRSKVIMTTALSDADSRKKAQNLKCDGYITKPFSRNDFENELKKLKFI